MSRAYFTSIALLALCACVTGRGSGSATRLAREYTPVVVPAQIEEKQYAWQRGIYDALPLEHPQRAAYRQVLVTHLIARAEAALDDGDHAAAFGALVMAATLYDPGQVYRERPWDGRVYQLASRVVRLFAPRGDVERVLPALCIQIGMRPNDPALQHEFNEILSWIDDTSRAVHGSGVEGKRAIDALEQAMLIWPSSFLVSGLYHLYVRRAGTLSKLAGARFFSRRRELTFAALQWTGYSIARLYVWVDKPEEALERLPDISSEQRDDLLRRLLQRAVKEPTNLEATLELAAIFERRDPLVALRVCRRASEHHPERAEAHACLGRLAAKLDRTALAVRGFSSAYRLEPSSHRHAERLAAQYQNQLFQLIEEEQLEAAERSLVRIERFYREAEQRLGKPMSPPLSKVRFALGFGQYNAGLIDQAIESLESSLRASPSPEALVQLATIALKAEDPTKALTYLDRTAKIVLDPAQRLYWRARATQLRAKALGVAGERQASLRAHEQAVDGWNEWLALDVSGEAVAEAKLRQGESLYELGQVGLALDAIDTAIDAAPSRKETYADAMALLVTRGHFPEALDVLHRTLGRPEVTEYLKSYCSLWIVGLARRAGLAPDPLAIAYLRRLSGSEWYHFLAKLALDKMPFAKLEGRAQTAAKRAELFFYQADRLLANGDLSQARELWQKVLDTRMMAFFEFDMALYNLRRGPAKVVTQAVDRRAERRR